MRSQDVGASLRAIGVNLSSRRLEIAAIQTKSASLGLREEQES